ncbi:MAG: hypothetical protein J6X33_06880 [Clostridiales bacterium]|nr:hypothetical protein [Clostridiales bacterium]
MYTVIIKTIGEVSFPQGINSSVGYRYDVPLGRLGIPLIPLEHILSEDEELPSGIRVGFAHPDGYLGLVKSANSLCGIIPNGASYVRNFFTNERFIPDKRYSVRSIKPGLTFTANIFFDEKDKDLIKKKLSSITHIGVCDDGITGEVKVKLTTTYDVTEDILELHDKCDYRRIDISWLIMTPICFAKPYQDGIKTDLFIPGVEIFRELQRGMAKGYDVDWGSLICSNAYISQKGVRFIPTPLCASVVKLDREQLRYRLAPGKDPSILEQDLTLEGTYTRDPEEHTMVYTVPETEKILSRNKKTYDALIPGQIFAGSVYGSDKDIRAIAEYITAHPSTNMGTLSTEGYGEVYCRIDSVAEDVISTEILSRSFDVCCASNVMLLGDNGLPVVSAEALKEELEYVLGNDVKLRVTGKFTDMYKDYGIDPDRGEVRPVVGCIAAGSVLRIECDDAIDISPILHTFIGERNRSGYGEIVTYPARGGYYRLADKVLISRYQMDLDSSRRDVQIGANFTKSVITDMVRSRIHGIAINDRKEFLEGVPADDLIPIDILRMMRDRFDPTLSDDILIEWYNEGLEG